MSSDAEDNDLCTDAAPCRLCRRTCPHCGQAQGDCDQKRANELATKAAEALGSEPGFYIFVNVGHCQSQTSNLVEEEVPEILRGLALDLEEGQAKSPEAVN